MITRFKNFLASSLPNLRGKRQHRRLAHSFVFVDPTTPIDRRVYFQVLVPRRYMLVNTAQLHPMHAS